jgi:hypothetical protein
MLHNRHVLYVPARKCKYTHLPVKLYELTPSQSLPNRVVSTGQTARLHHPPDHYRSRTRARMVGTSSTLLEVRTQWFQAGINQPTVAYFVHRGRRYTCSGEVKRRRSRQLFAFTLPSVCLDLSVKEFPGDEKLPQSFPEVRPVGGSIRRLNCQRSAC